MTQDIQLNFTQWIEQQIAALGDTVTHIEEVRASSTSSVFLVDTDNACYYAKTLEPVFQNEPALAKALAEWLPNDVPQVLAMDMSQGWYLMEDAGPILKDILKEDGDFSHWETFLRKFAKLQQVTVSHSEELLKLGVPDRTLAILPQLYQQLVANKHLLTIEGEDGISEAEVATLEAFIPEVKNLAQQLANYNIPATLHHDDFHVANIGLKDGTYKFFDWAESAIAHPFYSLMMSLRYAKLVFDADEALLNRLRDAYLEEWIAFEPMERLLEIVPLAFRLGALCRTLTWWNIVKMLPPDNVGDFGEQIPYWLMVFYHDCPMEMEWRQPS